MVPIEEVPVKRVDDITSFVPTTVSEAAQVFSVRWVSTPYAPQSWELRASTPLLGQISPTKGTSNSQSYIHSI